MNHRGMSTRRPNTHNGSSNYTAYDRRIEEANRTLLERENDERWAELGQSAAMLKSVSDFMVFISLYAAMCDMWLCVSDAFVSHWTFLQVSLEINQEVQNQNDLLSTMVWDHATY